MTVAVIGAGFAGLSAACHLRARGFDVEVLEASARAGGRASITNADGYRFDNGPTVVTMRQLLDDTFAAVGARTDDFCNLYPLDPIYRASFHDGSVLALNSDVDAMAQSIATFADATNADGYRRFVVWLNDLFVNEWPAFIDSDVRSVLDLARKTPELVSLAKMGGFGKWSAKMTEFFTDDRLRRCFSFQALYAGMSPLKALALFAIIAQMDTVQGVYGVTGGVNAAATGLASAAAGAGVVFRYGTEVTQIRSLGGSDKPVAVTTRDRDEQSYESVVVTVDLPIAYSDLIDIKAPWRQRRATFSPSCIVWHVTADGPLPDGTAHHNIHFSEPWEHAFDELLDARVPMDDPSRFVTIASASDPTAAPPGRHGLFVLEPVPNLCSDVDWHTETPRLTDRMLGWAHDVGYAVNEVVGTIDPLDWAGRGAAAGTPFSIDHRFSQSGPFRPDHEDRRVPGVVFAGAGTRPGVGVPMVLISGRVAAERVAARLTNRVDARTPRSQAGTVGTAP